MTWSNGEICALMELVQHMGSNLSNVTNLAMIEALGVMHTNHFLPKQGGLRNFLI